MHFLKETLSDLMHELTKSLKYAIFLCVSSMVCSALHHEVGGSEYAEAKSI